MTSQEQGLAERRGPTAYSEGDLPLSLPGQIEGKASRLDGLIGRVRKRVRTVSAFFRRPHVAKVETAPLRPYPWEASYPEGLQWQFDVPPQRLYDILDDSITAYPNRTCLSFLGKRYSYREVGALVAKAAKGFQQIGVGEGVRVGLFLPNSHYYVVCYYAILKAGGTVVNFNPLYAECEIAHQVRDSRVSVMVTLNLASLYPKIAGRLDDGSIAKIVVCSMSRALPLAGKALFTLLKRKEIANVPANEAHLRFDKLIANDGDFETATIDPACDVAVLQYTGGTTGLPKGAMLTHGNLYANTLQTRLWSTDLTPGAEKVLAVLPLFHVFGMTAVMNVGLQSGAEIVLLPRFRIGEVLKAIHRERPTLLLGVPTIYSSISSAKGRGKYDLSSLRYCVSGGAPLPLEVKKTFEGVTGCVLVEGYGLTEAGPVCTINPRNDPGKPGSAGLPIPGTVIEIVSLEDSTKTMPLGETGEVCVSGPQIMAGYWRQEAETDAVLRNGRLLTGDVGYLDEDGYLYLIDRIKDLIITGGYNVYPRVVEEALYLHPAVAEAAVCGIPDRHHGEIVKAFVILQDGQALQAHELRHFLKDKLAPFELPRRIEFLEELPKTLLGKPLRRELVAWELACRKKQIQGHARPRSGSFPTSRLTEEEASSMSLELVTESLRARALEFAPLKARVLFDLGDAGSLMIDATAMPPQLSNEPGKADCTIKTSLENLQKLLAGTLNPTFAYTAGKLKVEGSMGLAIKLSAMLDE